VSNDSHEMLAGTEMFSSNAARKQWAVLKSEGIVYIFSRLGHMQLFPLNNFRTLLNLVVIGQFESIAQQGKLRSFSREIDHWLEASFVKKVISWRQYFTEFTMAGITISECFSHACLWSPTLAPLLHPHFYLAYRRRMGELFCWDQHDQRGIH
jgi:hypothetical protein